MRKALQKNYQKFAAKKPMKQSDFPEKAIIYREIRETERKCRKEGMTAGERIVEELRLPGDMLRGNPIVTMCGRCKVVVENYKKLVVYDEEGIRILTTIGSIVISGKRLRVVYYTEDVLKIVGYIYGVEVVS